MSSAPSTGAEFAGNERFEIVQRLGAGGMGVVYRARDRQRRVDVALKTLRTLSPESLMRFKNEFRALRDLQHQNLVSLHELHSEHGQWFFTMELIEGVDLLTWVRPVPGVAAHGEDFTVNDTATTLEPRQGRALYEKMAAQSSLPALDERRLRSSLQQLARGLCALHGAGKVHRDVKPSNVLIDVRNDHRVVLLDFGLATDVDGSQYSETNVVGTADYMAPEQAASRPAGPAADWYSVGVILYEALTGRLPHSGAPLEVLIRKQREEPPPPRTVAQEVPRDLDALCVELLRTSPAARPSATEVLRRLGADDASTEIRLQSAHAAPPFVGRAGELRALEDAFSASRRGPVALVIEGQSGVGKSALARHFVDKLRASEPGAVILTGRCSERESVPYKALDGVVDALARYMMRLPAAEAASLLPLRVSLLAQVFPVLRRVEAVAEAPLKGRGSAAGAAGKIIDPQELRSRAFIAMRELFTRLGQRHPLVILIDDLQWADADSLALLAEALAPPDAPSLLLLATLRGPDELASSVVDRLGAPVKRVGLSRLPPPEARALVQALAKRAGGASLPDADAQAIAEEADGHPLFIDELVRHAIAPSGQTDPSSRLHLENALWARIARLEPHARHVLELLSVAGGPLPAQVIERAAPSDGLERALGVLRVAHLVRAGGATGDERLETYHDRVRAAVLLHLDAEATRKLHEKMALAFEAVAAGSPSLVDAETLCAHWRGAGDSAKAARYAAQAAHEAGAAFAFDRAARLYRLSLALERPAAGDAAYAIERLTRLGEALVALGRAGEAGVQFLEAAKRMHGGDAMDLQRRAAEQLLASGHIDEGLVALKLALTPLGLKLADTPQEALRSLVWQRLRLRLGGIRFRERDEGQLSPERLRRIDVCWSVAIGLGMVDTIRGADFQTRNLLYALKAGEPYRVARALAMEGAFLAAGGPSRRARAEQLFDAADRLAARLEQPHALGLAALGRGVMLVLEGEWRKGLEHSSKALDIFRERCTGVTWEINTCHQFILIALTKLGELNELQRLMPRLRRSARERGDLYAGTVLRTANMVLYRLALDQPDEARADVEEMAHKWSQQGFQMQHWWELMAKCSCDLYIGDGRTALDRQIARWPVLERSMILRSYYVRTEAHCLRGRARLATAQRLVPGDPERAPLLAAALDDARKLSRTPSGWSRGVGLLLEAGVLATRGEPAQAISLLREALADFERSEMALHAAATRRRLAQLVGGAEGDTLRDAAEEWFLGKVRAPGRMTDLLAPGF